MLAKKDLLCARCKNYLLQGPIQCSCGDRVCSDCFKQLSRGKEKFVCPECEAEVLVKECFRDRAMSREISKTSLHCKHPRCAWQGPVDQYNDHIKSCKFSPVACTYARYGCSKMCSKQDMPLHMRNCQFKSILTRDSVCKDYAASGIQENVLASSSAIDGIKDCNFKDVGCKFRGNLEELHIHHNSEKMQHLKMIIQALLSLQKEMDSKHSALAEQISDLMSEINFVNREISVKLHPVATALGKAETAIQNLQEGFSELALMVQTLQATSYNGTFIWKIPEVQRRRHEAKIGKTISLYSAPFYTSRQGYKACLRLYMDGDGCGKNTHLSFFVTIMKGEYDALLQWPFRHTVTLTLLDQDGVKNISQAFQPEPTSSSFQRPRNEMNIASGCPMFAPLPVLNNSSYVKEDTIFLKCEIESIGIVHP